MSQVIHITDNIVLDADEIQEDFARAGGPGGQHVNKASTAVRLRFDAARSPSLPEEVRQRLLKLAGRKATAEGVLVIQARRFRTQHRNREDAMMRLAALIRKASEKPVPRRKTRPSSASKKKRLEDKCLQARRKKHRRSVSFPDHEDL